MQDAQANSLGNELLVGTKVVDQGRVKVCRELCHLIRAHLPQLKPGGQCLTEPSQLVYLKPLRLEGFPRIHGQLARIGSRYQVLPSWGWGNHHIPGVQQLEERCGGFILWISRREMEIEDGEGHLRLSSRVRKYLPHAAFEDRCHATVQARVTIE
jgi:hypothetical protein